MFRETFAMALHFIEKVDFITIIATNALDQLSGGDDTIVLEMADVAVEEMKSFLCVRYNIENIFNATGTDRHKIVLMYAKDIALYHLHSRHHLKAIPKIRVKRYHQAIQWLVDVNTQKINLYGLSLITNGFVRTGSNPKRENHQL